MKTTLLSMLIVLSTSLLGQQKKALTSTISTPFNQARTNTETLQRISSAQSGAGFFYEDFANGFEGNNGIGAFTATDSGGEDDPIWRVADATSPCGEFSSPAQALQSSTADNGWLIFDADCWNTPIADGSFDVQGVLVSPELDMSARNSVIVEWDHNFRYCCFSPSPLTLGVSTDGGITWSDFPAHGTYIEGSDSFYPVLTTSVDISCAAANESNVIVRWAFNSAFEEGYSHYFWQIDDIRMYEAEIQNDLSIRQISNGNIREVWEYRYVPLCMATSPQNGGLEVGVVFSNEGAVDQNDVDIVIDILVGDEVVYTGGATGLTIPSAANSICPYVEDSMFFQTGWAPMYVGDYTLRVTIANDGVMDETPENNVLTKTMTYSQDVLSHADPSTFDGEFGAHEIDASGVFRNHGFAAVFHSPNGGDSVRGINVAFGADTDSNMTVIAGLYTGANPAVAGAQLIGFQEYTIQSEDIPADVDGTFYTYIAFDDLLQDEAMNLNADSLYSFFISREEEGTESFSIYGTFDSDTDYSSRYLGLSGSEEYLWFETPTTHGIELVVEPCWGPPPPPPPNSIPENEIVGLSLGQNLPNPFSTQSVISYTLAESISLSFEVRDIAGKVVMFEDFGAVQVGAHIIELNAGDFEAGIYTYSLISGDSRTTKKMVITE